MVVNVGTLELKIIVSISVQNFSLTDYSLKKEEGKVPQSQRLQMTGNRGHTKIRTD